MLKKKQKKIGRVIIPAGVRPWPHELRVAEILAEAGHRVEFISKTTNSIPTPDILLDGTEFEIKSPFTNKIDKLERNIKRALRQASNIVYDSSRIKNLDDNRVKSFLTKKAKTQPQIKQLIMITKQNQIIYIKSHA